MKLFRSLKGKTAAQPATDRGGPSQSHGSELLAQIDQLMERNRKRRDPEVERRLVRVRHEAFQALGSAEAPSLDSTEVEELRVTQGLPVVPPDRLTGGAVRAGIESHGCVHVPGLVSSSRVESLTRGIDLTFAAYDADAADGADNGAAAWYEPFRPLPGYKLGGGRKWNREGGAIWAADSPRLMFELVDAFDELGLAEVIGGYLGERPALSMNKSVLRRVSPETSGADWHQDGAFLGSEIKSLNVWLTLSDCGRDAPGMDVVPRRLEGIVETGGEGANFDWSVSPAAVERVAGGDGVSRPVFQAGDALLFDHLFLHRTATDPGMTRDRYAVETWFFAPSAYPVDQVPLVL